MKKLYLFAALCGFASLAMAQPGGGGEDFLLEGNNSFNLGLNECESDDPAFPNLRFTLSGVQTGILISDGSGQYALPLAQGVHTLTPELENPEYFDVSPSQVTVTFPNDPTPALRNFCVNPNGVHPDMEVVVVPMGDALPGSTVSYRLVYRNKGNQLMSGSVSLSYDAQAMSFISSEPEPEDIGPGMLTFNFEDVNPFRANHILLNFMINTQMGDPPVSPGDELNFTATVATAQDVNPADNTYFLTDVATESASSMQMICVEGENVGASTVGSYVHYLVRFENTNDEPVENLVITSELNPGELDISSVVIIKGSHDFHCRIIGNTLLFYLDNIGLPGLGLENKGYILYRVRTSGSLVAGSTFSNSATVQFDQSAPITTNTFTTMVQALETSQFDFADHFTLYPNPATAQVSLRSKSGLLPKRLTVYDMLGQQVVIIGNPGEDQWIDLSKLRSGTYLVRIDTDRGPTSARLVKI